MSEIIKHKEVNLRKSNPTLYRSNVVFGVILILQGINFWTSNPTFNPYNIPKNLVGLIFFVLGVWHMIFLHVWRDLRKIRINLWISSGVVLFWGLINTQQSVAGRASFQLPIWVVGLAALQLIHLIDAAVNPLMEKE